MIKRIWSKIVRFFRLKFGNYYDPFFKTKDGMQYAKMQNGMVIRLDNKKAVKRKQKIDELKKFFKR